MLFTMRMEHLLYLLLLNSVCHLLHWVGMTNLNYGKTKNKGFIVQYVPLQLIMIIMARMIVMPIFVNK